MLPSRSVMDCFTQINRLYSILDENDEFPSTLYSGTSTSPLGQSLWSQPWSPWGRGNFSSSSDSLSPETLLDLLQAHCSTSTYDSPQPHSTLGSYDTPQLHSTCGIYDSPQPHSTRSIYDSPQPHSTPSIYDSPQPHSTPSIYDSPQTHSTPSIYGSPKPHSTLGSYDSPQPHSTLGIYDFPQTHSTLGIYDCPRNISETPRPSKFSAGQHRAHLGRNILNNPEFVCCEMPAPSAPMDVDTPLLPCRDPLQLTSLNHIFTGQRKYSHFYELFPSEKKENEFITKNDQSPASQVSSPNLSDSYNLSDITKSLSNLSPPSQNASSSFSNASPPFSNISPKFPEALNISNASLNMSNASVNMSYASLNMASSSLNMSSASVDLSPASLNLPPATPRPRRLLSPRSRAASRAEQATMCTFCRKNGETPLVYRTHCVKQRRGSRWVVTCPILRSHVCDACGQSGDDAHTITYCPVVRISNQGHLVPSTTVTLKNTKIKSNGRRRF